MLDRAGPVELRFRVEKTRFTPVFAGAGLTSVIAVPAAAERVVPVRQACGRLVDWYRPSASAGDP